MKTTTSTIAILALLTVVGCVNRQEQKQARETEKIIKDKTVMVETMTMASTTVKDTIDLTGTIETSDDANVTAIVAGAIVAVYVKDGDVVSAGQLIAKFDESDYRARFEQASAQVKALRAALDQAKADAQVGPLKSEAQVKAGEARLEQAKARLQKLLNGARPEEKRQAEAQLQKARSDKETSKLAVERARRLFNEGATSKADLERAENQYAASLAAYESALEAQQIAQGAGRDEDIVAARQDVQAAEQQLSIDKANKRLDVLYSQRVESAQGNFDAATQNMNLARIALENTELRSPFSGRVSGKPLQLGAFVAPGVTVARVVGTAGAYFEAEIPESKISVVRTGATVNVVVDAIGGAIAKGTLVAINPQATNAGRIFFGRVRLDQVPSDVRSGMFARGTVEIEERAGVYLVPSEAIVKESDRAYVFVVAADKAQKKEVTLGSVRDGMTEVIGVAPGDTVVVKGQATLTDGAAVKAPPATVAQGA